MATPDLHSYAILDAARVTNLPELLERSGLDHHCLFTGAAFEELKNVAPWIVRLEEDNHFTRHLFTRSDAHWHLWATEPGIYIRSPEPLGDIWRHVRKFTKLRDEDGAWHHWLFWHGRSLCKLARHDATEPLVAALLRDEAARLIAGHQVQGEMSVMRLRAGHAAPPLQPGLTRPALAVFQHIAGENAREDLAAECGVSLDAVEQRWDRLVRAGMRDIGALTLGVRALLRLSLPEIATNEDLRQIVGNAHLGDGAKARLIDRATG